MCTKRIIGAALLGSLIQGSAGKCMSPEEIQSAYMAQLSKASLSCMTALSQVNGATPPACNGATACTVDALFEMSLTCTGANCRYMPATASQNMTQQSPLCMPAACQNAEDGNAFMGAASMAMSSGLACSTTSSNTSGSSMEGVSITQEVSLRMISLVCDGKVISKSVKPDSASGAPKLETCLDVKKEFQRQACCDMPTKMFDMSGMGMKSGTRRLSQDTLVEDVKLFLEEAKMQGGAAHASNIAADLISFVGEFAQKV